jgi:hypothetical protein
VAEEEKLKFRKGVAFDKSRLKRLHQIGETWEADFRVLPKPINQSVTHYRGMVVTEEGGSLLSESHVHGRPSVNDLATLLAHAMRRPLEGKARPPKLVRLRGHHQWRELFPVLKELGVDVSVERELPICVNGARSGGGEPRACVSSVAASLEHVFPQWNRQWGGQRRPPG